MNVVSMEAGLHRFRRGRQKADGDLRRLGRASWRSSGPVELITGQLQNGHLALGNGRGDVWSRSAHLSSPTQPQGEREPLLTGKERDSDR
jgi:hypothetical protein